MSAPKLAGRTLSHRKPVPKFIPTPPASPHGSPTLSQRRLSFSLTSVGQDAPPLPSDWRDIIERAVSRERRTPSTLPAIDTVVDVSSHNTHVDDTDLPTENSPTITDFGPSGTITFTPPSPTESCRDEPSVSRPSSPTPWAPLGRSMAKQPFYHEEYRPPTPPLSNHRKRSRSSESGCDSPTPTFISQLGPHFTLALASDDFANRTVAPSISLEPPPPPPPPPSKSSLPTPPASLLIHDIPSPPYHAGHAKSFSNYAPTVSSTYTPGHDRRPSTLNSTFNSTLNSTLNFTFNSDKWTEDTTASSAQPPVKTDVPINDSDFPSIHPDREVTIRTKRRWWQSVARGFKRCMLGLWCL